LPEKGIRVISARLFTPAAAVFLLTVAIALGFALYTDHRWEDWYITYRASKNLAMGHGLLFSVGERVHSFTSPIGTLIPALLAYLTNLRDEWVIWLYRVISAGVLGLAAVQLYTIARGLYLPAIAQWLLVGLFATNTQIVDFSINGMETAFMMLFLAYFMRLLLLAPEQGLLWRLALTMAALMYTRPDSVVYAGVIGILFLIVSPQLNAQVQTRKQFILLMLKAAAIGFVLYLPWIIGTWLYYGSPIPHTVQAKSSIRYYNFGNMVRDFMLHPWELLKGSKITGLFLPAYAWWGWASWASSISWGLCIAAFFGFIAAVKNAKLQALSVSAFLIAFYLESVSGYGPAPWYMPNLSIVVILVLALLVGDTSSRWPRARKPMAVLAVLMLAFSSSVLVLGAVQMKAQQEIIETGHRKEIGLWLKAHAKPTDTLFLECLGYIGFYSELKTYDYPGMSSPESVSVLKRLGPQVDFSFLIDALKPDWLVLRPEEITAIEAALPNLLTENYQPRKVFDVSDQIPPGLIGREFLMHDRVFTVFQRKEE
jgi:hypothetical protein